MPQLLQKGRNSHLHSPPCLQGILTCLIQPIRLAVDWSPLLRLAHPTVNAKQQRAAKGDCLYYPRNGALSLSCPERLPNWERNVVFWGLAPTSGHYFWGFWLGEKCTFFCVWLQCQGTSFLVDVAGAIPYALWISMHSIALTA